MSTRQTSDNVKQLEQLAFNAGISFVLANLDVVVPNVSRPEPEEAEDAVERWRQLKLVQSLERQVMNG